MPKIIYNGINYTSSGADWLAQENSEGFISNKPPLNSSIGVDSIVEGQALEARGQGSHAEGVGTIAPLSMGAHVQGKYNADYENTNLIDVVGWGDDANNRKNLSALTADGQLILKRSIKIGANDDSTGGIYLPVPGTGGGLDPDKTYSLTSVGNTMYWRDIPEPGDIPQADEATIVSNSENVLSIAPHIVPTPDGLTLIADSENVWSVDLQNTAPDWAAADGDEGFIKNKPNVIVGSDYDGSAVVVGDTTNNDASGTFSVAEGTSTSASGQYAHAEGSQSVASGESSHAEGVETLASGKGAHAEGQKTVAAGAGSHAEGIGTYTNIGAASVRGKWNVKTGNYIDVVGGGTNDSNRVNLSALVASGATAGRLILKDSIVIGANPNSTGGYVIPVPDAAIQDGDSYVLSYNYNDDAFVWTKLEVTDTNKYQRDPSAPGAGNGPFTIYDGTVTPTSALGKPGDIYFRHS